jgi:hypothetical protein
MYLLINDWSQFPENLPKMKFKIKSVSIHGNSIDFKTNKDGRTTFIIPDEMKDPYVTVIRIETSKDLTGADLIDL